MCLSFSDTCFKPRVCVSPCIVGYHHQLFYLSELEKHFECVCHSLTLFPASCLRESQIVCIYLVITINCFMCLEKHFECVCLSLTLFQASCLRESQIVCI